MANTYIGIAGMALILAAYLLNQTGRWKEDDTLYDLVNLIGALLLVVYAFAIEGYAGWPFVILNAVWAAVAGRDLYEKYKPAPAAKQEKEPEQEAENEVEIEDIEPGTEEKGPEEVLSERRP